MNTEPSDSSSTTSVAVLMLGLFYLGTSYAFYNLNHYKLLMAWSACAVLLALLCWNDFSGARQGPQPAARRPSIMLALFCLIPPLTALPGLLATRGLHAYFFGQEVALWLVCCGWMLLLIRLLRDHHTLAKFLQTLALIVIAIAVLALWRGLQTSSDVQSLLAERESGTFGNPNYLACFLVMHIPLFALCGLSSWQVLPDSRERLHDRALFLLAALLALAALFLTQSRVAMMTLALLVVALTAMVVLMPEVFPLHFRRGGALLLGVLTITCAGALIAFPEISDSLNSSLRSTVESRLVPWRAAWASILDAPWFGWGSGSSYSLFFQYVDPASRLLWHERSYAHTHNEILEILQEGGISGLLGYFVFVGLVLRRAWRLLLSKTLPHDFRIVVVGIVCAIAAYHVAGLSSVDSRMAVVRFALFTLLGILFSLDGWAGAASQPVNSSADSVRQPQFFTIKAAGSYVTVVMLLTISAILLVPDLASRYRYVRIMQQADGQSREQLLEDLRDDNPNAYALERLVQLELASSDSDGASRTLAVLDSLIPDYSISGYFKAANLFQQNRLAQAKAAALDYQQRDRYLPETAYLLARIAIMDDDRDLLQQQLGLLLTEALVSNGAFSAIDAHSVHVETVVAATSCRAAHLPPDGRFHLNLSINRESFDLLISEAGMALDAPETDAAAGYRKLIAGGISTLRCQGLSEQQTTMLRASLQQVLLGLVSRDH